jgi:TetR/AcrR family transcriptional regulator, mexJK operon transcriptional repressor
MSSVQPEVKESLRARDTVRKADEEDSVRSVAAMIRSLSEERSKPKAKEQEVLDVATAYFLKHGYQGASINAMARSSGISKESIYRYFSSKKQLFEAVIGRELMEYQESLQRLSTSKTIGLREALVTLAETVLGVVTTDRTRALRRLIFDEARRSPDVGQHYYKIGPERAYAAFEEVFKAHHIDSDYDAAVLSRHLMAMVSWRVMLELECAVIGAPTSDEMRRRIESVVDDFMKAFLRSQ